MEQHKHFCVICGALVDEEVLNECMIQADHAFGLCQECDANDRKLVVKPTRNVLFTKKLSLNPATLRTLHFKIILTE